MLLMIYFSFLISSAMLFFIPRLFILIENVILYLSGIDHDLYHLLRDNYIYILFRALVLIFLSMITLLFTLCFLQIKFISNIFIGN